MKHTTFTKHLGAAVVFSALTVSSVQAEDAVDAIIQGWSGSATMGMTNATGNSEASNISAAIRLGKTVGKWEHLVFGSLFQGSSAIVVEERDANGEVVLDTDGRPSRKIVKGDNSDRIALGYQPRYYWRPRTYFFGILDYEKDKPANVKSATRQVIGVGHKFYSNQTGFFSAEAGFGNKNTQQVFGDDINGGIGYLGLNYLNRFSDNVTFNADFRADFGSENTFTEIGLGLAFKLSEKMALKITHFQRGNSDISDGTNPLDSSTDGVTSFNLVFDI